MNESDLGGLGLCELGGHADLENVEGTARAEDGDPVDFFGQISGQDHSVAI